MTKLRPVCILGNGLIGGSLMRDLAAHNHPTFGYTHSNAGARQAAADGFDVIVDLEAVLRRAEDLGALIVIAVPFDVSLKCSMPSPSGRPAAALPTLYL